MLIKLLAISLGIVVLGAVIFSIVSFTSLSNTSAKTVSEDSQIVAPTEKSSHNTTNISANPDDISDRLA